MFCDNVSNEVGIDGHRPDGLVTLSPASRASSPDKGSRKKRRYTPTAVHRANRIAKNSV